MDDKSQIQALNRSQKRLPVQPLQIERRPRDYVGHATPTLFAALGIATGHVTGAGKPRHRNQESLAFLKRADRAYPDQELHGVMDNYATHKRVAIRDWLAANPRIHVNFHPHVEVIVEPHRGLVRDHHRQAIRRGVSPSVKDRNAKIRAIVDG